MKVIGFATRAVWSLDITRLQLGLTSEVFLIVSTFVIVSANLILAQRLFTWRHPVGGSRKLFWFTMMALYSIVCVIIAITILASFVPYLYFLSEKSYRSWIHTVQFTAVLIIAYCFTSVALIGLSFGYQQRKMKTGTHTSHGGLKALLRFISSRKVQHKRQKKHL